MEKASSIAEIELAYGVAWNHLCLFGLTNQELAKLGQI